MIQEMMGYCGTYCETCDWKEKVDCKGCKAYHGEMFWGTCTIAKCAIDKELKHCGECDQLPCEQLIDAYKDPEHGDHGERLENLNKWSKGKVSTLKVRSKY